MKYHLLHLGCQMNQSDAERVRTVIERMGYEPTQSEEEADLLGLVACSVRQKAIDKVYARIRPVEPWKNRKSLLTFATGCILPADREKFLPHVRPASSTSPSFPALPAMIGQYGVVTPAHRCKGALAMRQLRPPDGDVPASLRLLAHRAAVLVDDSRRTCPSRTAATSTAPSARCPTRAAPRSRGHRRRSLQEIAGLLDRGYVSFTLLGQNVNSYGKDQPAAERTFPELLRDVGDMCDASGRECRVYFTSPHPRDMSEESLRVIADHRSLARQIHLPLQSGDDRVLVRMNRSYQMDDYRQTVARVRDILPDGDAFHRHHRGLQRRDRRAVRKHPPRDAGVQVQHGVRRHVLAPGAASAHWADDVPHEEKARWLKVLSEELARPVRRAQPACMIGTTVRLLVEGPDRKKGFLSGRTKGGFPVRFRSDGPFPRRPICKVRIIPPPPFNGRRARTGGLDIVG